MYSFAIIENRAIEVILTCLIALVIAQILKFLISLIKNKKINWVIISSTGGFPSSHTAFVVSLCVILGLLQIHDNNCLDWSFSVACVFAVIVIYDATGVRLEASKHAKILNNIAADFTEEEKFELGYGTKGKLKEMLGHKTIEVIGGIFVGIAVAIIGYFIIIYH